MSLTVSNGLLYLDGQVCREVGLNGARIFWRLLYNSSDTEWQQNLLSARQSGYKVVRVFVHIDNPAAVGGLNTYGTATGFSAAFYVLMDAFVAYAASIGLQLIPCLFPLYTTVPTYKGETANALANSASASRAYLRSSVTEFVTRYNASPAIAAWQFTNEWSNYSLLGVVPSGADSVLDVITQDALIDSLRDMAQAVRAVDSARAILSGNGGCWYSTTANLYGLEGFAQLMFAMNPDPIDTVSAHVYSSPDTGVWNRMGFEPLATIVGEMKRCAKPFVLGETGVPESLQTLDRDKQLLTDLLESDGAPQLTLMYNWYKPESTSPSSNTSYDYYVSGNRAYWNELVNRARGGAGYSSAYSGEVAPTQWASFFGAQACTVPMPALGAVFSVSFWARWANTSALSTTTRMLSATTDETNNGFTIQQRSSPSSNAGEPFLSIYNGSAQSAANRSAPLSHNKWQHYTYVWRYYATTFTASTSTDLLTLGAALPLISVGDMVSVSSTGTLPTFNGSTMGTSTNYFLIPTSPTTCYVATSQSDAILKVAGDFTNAGSGTHTVTCRFVEVYYNGLKVRSPQATSFTGAYVAPGGGNLVIGADRTAAANFWYGQMAKVRFWARGLSELEVWQEYTGKTPDGAASYLVDGFSGLTTVGAPTWTNSSPRAQVARPTVARAVGKRGVQRVPVLGV